MKPSQLALRENYLGMGSTWLWSGFPTETCLQFLDIFKGLSDFKTFLRLVVNLYLNDQMLRGKFCRPSEAAEIRCGITSPCGCRMTGLMTWMDKSCSQKCVLGFETVAGFRVRNRHYSPSERDLVSYCPSHFDQPCASVCEPMVRLPHSLLHLCRSCATE